MSAHVEELRARCGLISAVIGAISVLLLAHAHPAAAAPVCDPCPADVVTATATARIGQGLSMRVAGRFDPDETMSPGHLRDLPGHDDRPWPRGGTVLRPARSLRISTPQHHDARQGPAPFLLQRGRAPSAQRLGNRLRLVQRQARLGRPCESIPASHFTFDRRLAGARLVGAGLLTGIIAYTARAFEGSPHYNSSGRVKGTLRARFLGLGPLAIARSGQRAYLDTDG